MAAPTFARARAGYQALWDKMEVKRVNPATSMAKKCLSGKARYKTIETKTKVPWYVIALMHMREGDFDFRTVLHNGERIIGTGRKTKLVPKGRGPFDTFEEAAIDALADYRGTVWTLPRIAYTFEKFNGFGYRSHGIPSPYLWGGSSVQKPGKYVRDGVYSSSVMDQQLGCMTVLRQLMDLDDTVSFDDKPAAPPPDPEPEPKVAAASMVASPKAEEPEDEEAADDSIDTKNIMKSKTFWGSVTAGGSTVLAAVSDWKVIATILTGVAVAACIFIVYERWKKPDIK